jgi:hypothetical protein
VYLSFNSSDELPLVLKTVIITAVEVCSGFSEFQFSASKLVLPFAPPVTAGSLLA